MEISNEVHYKKLENMYHEALCNDYYEPRLSVEKGVAQILIPIKKSFYHAAGAVHGSVYFKALDDAAFFSANSLVEKVFVLTSNFTIYFTAPVLSGTLVAKGKVVNTTRSQIIAESILYDSKNREIARGMGSFVRSTIELTSEIGYK